MQQKRIQTKLLAFSKLKWDDPWLWENMHQLLSEIFSDIALQDMSSQTFEECIEVFSLDAQTAQHLIEFRDRYYAGVPDRELGSLHKSLDAVCRKISRWHL